MRRGLLVSSRTVRTPEVGQHLGAQAEVAQRRPGRGRRRAPGLRAARRRRSAARPARQVQPRRAARRRGTRPRPSSSIIRSQARGGAARRRPMPNTSRGHAARSAPAPASGRPGARRRPAPAPGTRCPRRRCRRRRRGTRRVRPGPRGRTVVSAHPPHQQLARQPVLDEVGDAHDAQAVLGGEALEVGQARHLAVLAHDLADHAGRLAAGQARQIDAASVWPERTSTPPRRPAAGRCARG